ncbi:MAG: flagellar hook-basal body complex protein [Firmicutes bacterium]|nr:flagellar hook-basal body complex protein [Dethiobacter sp.]MBS3888659.1 flagellar hook-basal body complex protein [Bacillota bacterium]MBS4053317.1 flagellar hook-basal body complex protein [Thermaerobacter sp.]
MLRGLYQATAAMVVAKAKQENISGNISNVETVGFKRQVLSEEIFSQAMLMANVGTNSTALGGATARAAVSEPELDWTRGQVTASDSPYHLALVGRGLFAVERDGEVRFTRAGDFRLDASGYITDAFGGRLLLSDGNPLRTAGESFRVAENGEVFLNDTSVGFVQVADFAELGDLTKDENGQFIAAGAATPAAEVQIKQHHLELSNVDLAKEIMDMLLVSRVFQSAQRIVSAYDQLMERTSNIGSAR